MEKYNFTMQHLYGENHQHITKILEVLQAGNLEEGFVRKFYATIPMINLTEDDYYLYAELARNAFNFLHNYQKDKTKINIYQGSNKTSDADHTIIEILSNDMPFLFDSTMRLLHRLDIDVEKVAHPSLFVTRDDNNELLSIDESKNENNSQELIIQIRTEHALDAEMVKRIDFELNHILVLVRYTVNDWKNILGKLQKYTELYLDSTKVDQEKKEFLNNMLDKYFVYFGSIEYEIGKNDQPKMMDDSILGILKLEIEQFKPLIESTIFNKNFFEKNEQIHIGKLNKASLIHRDANIDYLCLRINNDKVVIFIGLFTSILYYQSATLIPIIRGKLNKVLERAGFSSGSYAGKEIVSIVESLPRDELFQISAEELFPMLMETYALLFSPELRIFLRRQGDTLSCLLFMPLDIVNAENVKKLKLALSFEYGPIVNHYFSQVSDSKLCYYYFVIDSRNTSQKISDLAQVEQELRAHTKPWDDCLNEVILKAYGKNKGKVVFNKFRQAFPTAYRENTIYNKAIIEDIESTSLVLAKQNMVFKIVTVVEGKANVAQLKIYNTEELNLSSVMPILQNIGLNVIAEQIYVIRLQDSSENVWLHQFILDVSDEERRMLEQSERHIEEALGAIVQGKCQNDNYNQLILRANLNYRQVTLLRALSEYLYQIKIGYSKDYMGQVLSKYFEVVKQIVSLFYFMFNPKISMDDRYQQINDLQEKLEQSLSLIHNNVEDQIIRRLIDLVKNILRTNYFLKDENDLPKDYISLKINSSKIMSMPLPKPYREIFVYSASFEGIHLRGGKVARGGIRWSDRLEDYRTEVLGLMKTQIVKNSVIVPTGAKGGFILKNTSGLDRDALQAKAIECYKNFLRGLLDITDNLVSGRVHHPKHIIRYDENDTYLVVAADKGTASFSDIANQISAEYKFWLGDAFASGGSKGYDHKKMAITARGGWISVVRHFSEMGINIKTTDFTVVGIGDMSGDVFGNGMLLSEHIKLIGAFNHQHIFIDPNPDSKKSFIERKRLFNLPRSTWQDYNPAILSKGAQIYERKEKILKLTDEIKERFNLTVDNITPDDLIKVLLTAKVDLLWNGGIGTYVKASFETHEQVGDKANDLLRCNGADLRCKIVGEGGNLGFTQYGRIEYARNGGRLNTDAIDNSAGVDCSDHEVNMKIALHQAIGSKLITEEERIKLLEAMTENVAELVLKDNITQTRALTIAEQEGYEILASQEHFVDILEELGILDRKLECLPSKQQFAQLHLNKTSLTRPELSVLLAYSKNAIYNQLIETKLPDDKYFYNDLLMYFPEPMQQKFSEILLNHPLRREIITTGITNSMVNRIDTFYLHLTVETTGHKFSDIASAYIVTRDLFGLRNLWKEINTLDGLVPVDQQAKLYIVVKKFVMRATSWLLRNYKGKLNIAAAIEEYSDKINELYPVVADLAIGKYKENYEVELKAFLDMKVPEVLAKKIAVLNLQSSAYNIAAVSNRYEIPVEKAALVYFEIGHRFSLDWLRHCANNLKAENNWQKLAIRGFKDELYDFNRKITSSAIDTIQKSGGSLDKWYKQNEKHIKLFDKFIAEIKSQNNIEYAMIDLSLKKLSILLTK